MEWKQYNRYRMDFDGKWLKTSAACMGGSVFALALYYFGMVNLGSIGAGKIILSLVLPMILAITYIVLTKFVRLNAPGIYAIIGAVFCLLLMFGSFSSGSVLRIVLSVVGYLLCGGVLVLCAGGFLPGKLPASILFGLVILVRLLVFDLGKIKGTGWIGEVAVLLILASLLFLPKAFQSESSEVK